MSILDGVKRPAFVERKPLEISISLEELESGVAAQEQVDAIVEEIAAQLQHTPRSTLLLMLQKAKLDEQFIFNVKKNGGVAYVQAMRAVLSRARDKAETKKQTLDQWKMLVVSITTEETMDVVTLVRSKTIKRLQPSVLTELLTEIGDLQVGE